MPQYIHFFIPNSTPVTDNQSSKHFKEVDLPPDDAESLRWRGEMYRWQGSYILALADFDRVVELEPNDDFTICRRGETYLLLAEYEKALDDFELALQLSPTNDWYYFQRGLLYLLTQEFEQANNDMFQAINIAFQEYEENPENWSNTFNLLFYYLGTNQDENAEAFCHNYGL